MRMITTTTSPLSGTELIDWEPLIIWYLVGKIVSVVVDKENSGSAQLEIHGTKMPNTSTVAASSYDFIQSCRSRNPVY